MASAVDSRLAYARLAAVATASRLPTATRDSNNSYTTSWDTTPAPPQFRRPTTPLATIRADPGAEHQCGLEAIRANLAYLLFDLEQDGDVDPGAGVTVERPDHLIRLRHLTGGPPMCAPKKGPHAPKPSIPPARPLARLANNCLAFLQNIM